MDIINLKKNKSIKYYLNQLPVDIIKVINENIPPEKKYKDKIKNKIKINKIIKSIDYAISTQPSTYEDESDYHMNIIDRHNYRPHFIDVIRVIEYENNRTKIKEKINMRYTICKNLYIDNDTNEKLYDLFNKIIIDY